MSLTLHARAKVNLRLRVLGKRPDGYHELSTLFDRISLADTVELAPAATTTLSCDAPDMPVGPANLAFRGAAAAIAEARHPGGVAIRLLKGVPAGAGLGGGSADAAATLVGTARLLGLGLADATLLSLARSLGADVPFFVHGHLADERAAGSGRMAFGRGVGEALTPVASPPPLAYVLLNPGFEVPTPRVFHEGSFPALAPGAQDAVAAPNSVGDVLALLRNDLEPVTSRLHPEIQQMIRALTEEGALAARMSGSGATVFGIFPSEASANDASERLRPTLRGTKIFVARGE